MKVSKSKSVSIDADTAKHVCELFDSIELADKFFKSCQNTEFRQHVKGVYKAQHVA